MKGEVADFNIGIDCPHDDSAEKLKLHDQFNSSR
jgi:hypothetical protein